MPIPAEARRMSEPWAARAARKRSRSLEGGGGEEEEVGERTAVTKARASGVRMRTVSVRPSWKRRVWAAS